TAHVGCSVPERNSRLGHPYEFHRLLRRNRKLQRLWIGQTNVFARKNDDSPRDEPEIFPRMQHFRQPVHRAFFVRCPHAFNKRADRVIMRIPCTVVHDSFLLDAFFGHLKRELNCTITSLWGRSEYSNFQGILTLARVAVAKLCEMAPRIVMHLHIVISESALL